MGGALLVVGDLLQRKAAWPGWHLRPSKALGTNDLNDSPTARETARLAALHRYRVLDTEAEAEFEQMVLLAERMFRTPIALISLVDAERQWFKARRGFGVTETPRSIAFCDHAVRSGAALLVPDAMQDPRFAGNPLVTGEPGIRFYAGAPLITAEGQVLGTVCVMDSAPRHDFSPADQATLEDLARVVIDKLDLRLLLLQRQATARAEALNERLLAVTAEAEDFAAGLLAAAELLLDASQGVFLHVWLVDADATHCRFVSGRGKGYFGTAACFDALRAAPIEMDASWLGRVLQAGEVQWVEQLTPEQIAALPLGGACAAAAVAGIICVPFVLEDARYAFALGLGPARAAFHSLVELMTNGANALRPLLRRLQAEQGTQLFRRVIEASPDPVLITQKSEHGDGHRIVYANRAFEENSGYGQLEVIGHSPEILFGAETAPQERAQLAAALTERQTVRLEMINYRKDGSTHWAELNVSPIMNWPGQAQYAIWGNSDVTEQRALQAERLAIASDLEVLTEAMPGAVTQMEREPDGGWRPLYLSPSLTRLTGCPLPEIAAPGWLNRHVAPADAVLLRQRFQEAVDSGEAAAEFDFQHPDGSIRRLNGRMQASRAPDGGVQLVGIWADLTVERAVAAQLVNSSQLAHLGEVATGMAHELAQPLAAISIAVENAQRALPRLPEARDRISQKLDLVVEMTQRTAVIIDDMRIFGTAGAGDVEAVLLAPLIAATRPLLTPKLYRHGITLDVQFPQDLPAVRAKRVALEQVFINLISNACDAYKGNSANTVRLVELRGEVRGQMVRATVQDYAGGIPPEVQPHIFDPFFTTKISGEGTGLGLSISVNIIADLGGSLSVHNHNCGACFVIELPIAAGLASRSGALGGHRTGTRHEPAASVRTRPRRRHV